MQKDALILVLWGVHYLLVTLYNVNLTNRFELNFSRYLCATFFTIFDLLNKLSTHIIRVGRIGGAMYSIWLADNVIALPNFCNFYHP